MSHSHTFDSDCTLTDFGTCSESGVCHGDPCPLDLLEAETVPAGRADALPGIA